MKPLEAQKAELLDEVVRSIKITQMVLEGTNTPLPKYATAILERYELIIAPANIDNLMIESVFDLRICNVIRQEMKAYRTHPVYLKDVPPVQQIIQNRGFGRKSESIYKEVLKEYNLHEKL